MNVCTWACCVSIITGNCRRGTQKYGSNWRGIEFCSGKELLNYNREYLKLFHQTNQLFASMAVLYCSYCVDHASVSWRGRKKKRAFWSSNIVDFWLILANMIMFGHNRIYQNLCVAFKSTPGSRSLRIWSNVCWRCIVAVTYNTRTDRIYNISNEWHKQVWIGHPKRYNTQR